MSPARRSPRAPIRSLPPEFRQAARHPAAARRNDKPPPARIRVPKMRAAAILFGFPDREVPAASFRSREPPRASLLPSLRGRRPERRFPVPPRGSDIGCRGTRFAGGLRLALAHVGRSSAALPDRGRSCSNLLVGRLVPRHGPKEETR